MRDLAGLVGVSSVTVWKWEKGDSKPRARLIAPLARALDVPPRQLQSFVKDADKPEALAEAELLEKVGTALPRQPETVVQEEGGLSNQAEALSDVIARAKQMIADASGTGSNNITILIEY